MYRFSTYNLSRGSVSISDDGPGVCANFDRNRTEPFQTGNTAREGAGLGLSIVQEIMAAHGGALTITSNPGCGTTACLRFPEAAQATPGEIQIPQRRVVVVEGSDGSAHRTSHQARTPA